MKTPYIYSVGQPETQSGTVDAIHATGYKAGILLDVRLTKKNTEVYDRVIEVNFADIDSEILRLDMLNLEIAGLLCTYENYIVAKAKLGEYFNVPAPSLESAHLSTDKSLMRQAFIDADSSISPNFSIIDTLEHALEFVRGYGYPIIIKPTNLVKSLLVLRCNNEQELIENFNYSSKTITSLYEKYNIYERSPQLIIEEFITGKQCSIAAFVDEKGEAHFCDGIVELINAQDILVSDNYLYRRTLPYDFDDTLSKEMFSVAKKGVEALKMRSVPAHIELMYGDKGVKIIEIGARIGGYRPRMYKYSYGLNLIEQEIRLAIGLAPELEGSLQNYCAVFELFPKHEGAFVRVTNNEKANQYTYYRETTASGKIVGPAKNGYKAAAILIAVSNEKSKLNDLSHMVDLMEVEVA